MAQANFPEQHQWMSGFLPCSIGAGALLCGEFTRFTPMSYWDHIKQSYEAVNIYDGPDVFLHDYSQLPVQIGDLLATHWTLSEVSNGGLHQFFLNSTGVLAPEAVQGFERMGLAQIASVLRSAMVRMGDPYPREVDQREPFLADHGPEVFEPLERMFYEIGAADLGRIYDVMDEYAERNVVEQDGV